ncbi:MAG: hypothetical protein M3Q58_02480 [Bacteroidota bacterium]|nr:hypothetical protein [Bacteroidota bacterium]
MSTDQLISRLFATDCWLGLPSLPDDPLFTLVTPAWAYKSGVIYTGSSCPASVGIGTDSPQSSLDIRGNIQISGSRFHVGNNGRIGIGTSTPGAKLEIRGVGNQSIDIFTSTLGSRLTLMAVTSNGVRESQIQYAGGGRFGLVEIGHGFRMMIDVNGNVGIGTNSPSNKLDVVGTGKFSNNVIVDGSIGIGCNSPQFKLHVNGTVKATHVKVNSAGCDFVFDEDYKLPSISERNNFIIKNKHLPYIKSAKDMQENGMELAETAEGLLQNMEEMSLHQIAHEEKIELLFDAIIELKKLNEEQRKEIEFFKNALKLNERN